MKASFLVGSKLTFAFSQGIALVILAQLGGAAMTGQYALLVAVISPVFLLSNLRIQDVLATRSADAPVSELLTLTRTTNFFAALLCCGGGVIMTDGDLRVAVVAFSIAKYFESLSNAAYGYSQVTGRMGRAGISNVSHGFFVPLALLVGMAIWGTLGASLILVAVVWGDQYYGWERTFFEESSRGSEWRLRMDWRLGATLAPLGISAMLLSANQTLVRVPLAAVGGASALGVFAAVAYSVRIGALISRGVAEANVRGLSAGMSPNSLWAGARRPLLISLGLGVVSGIVLVGLGPDLWPIVFGSEFKPTRPLFAVVALAGLLVYATTALTLAVVASGRHHGQMVASVTGLIVTAVSVVPAIHLWQEVGAAAAWALGEGVRFGLMVWQLLRPEKAAIDD